MGTHNFKILIDAHFLRIFQTVFAFYFLFFFKAKREDMEIAKDVPTKDMLVIPVLG